MFTADSLVYVADAKAYEIRAQTFAGVLRRIIRVFEPPTLITDDLWRKLVERRFPPTMAASERAAKIGRLLAMPRPRNFPAYGHVRIDQSRRLWIRADSQSGAYMLFDAGDRLLGRFDLPHAESAAQARLVGVGTDHVIVSWRDSDGAAHLSIYRLLPGR